MNIEFLTQKNNQKELAQIANVDQKTISNYLNKKTEPTETVLKKLANHFNVSLDYLCDRPFNNGIGYINDRQRQLINDIKELDEWQLNKLEGYIAALKTAKEDVQKEISKRG